jgi:hypothetical protein
MNKELISLSNAVPKIENLSADDIKAYKTGLNLLGLTVCNNFLDVPMIDLKHKYERGVLFYEIPYLHSNTLWTQSNQRCLLVVYKIENESSWCPLRIDFKYEITKSDVNYWLYVYAKAETEPKSGS